MRKGCLAHIWRKVLVWDDVVMASTTRAFWCRLYWLHPPLPPASRLPGASSAGVTKKGKDKERGKEGGLSVATGRGGGGVQA
jgi:hypothetical protein